MKSTLALFYLLHFVIYLAQAKSSPSFFAVLVTKKDSFQSCKWCLKLSWRIRVVSFNDLKTQSIFFYYFSNFFATIFFLRCETRRKRLKCFKMSTRLFFGIHPVNRPTKCTFLQCENIQHYKFLPSLELHTVNWDVKAKDERKVIVSQPLASFVS